MLRNGRDMTSGTVHPPPLPWTVPSGTQPPISKDWDGGVQRRQPVVSPQGKHPAPKHASCRETSQSFLLLRTSLHHPPLHRLWPSSAESGKLHHRGPRGAASPALSSLTGNSTCDKLSLLLACPLTVSRLTSLFQFLPDLFRDCFHLLPSPV